jgi:hypothetical protein
MYALFLSVGALSGEPELTRKTELEHCHLGSRSGLRIAPSSSMYSKQALYANMGALCRSFVGL